MAIKTIRRMCSTCNQPRPFHKTTPSHILHLLLTIVTCGFWGIIWILLILSSCFAGWKCQFCAESKL